MRAWGCRGLQINYAHTDRGGRSYGLTMPSDPPLFSEEWWKLVGWFLGEAKQRGIAVSLSDYTLGIGQGWCVDEMLREHPELTGEQLRLVTGSKPADALVSADVPGPDGKPRRVAVGAVKVPYSLDPMNPLSGPEYARRFFGQFEDHFPGEGGKGLNFFFSDELSFGVGGRLWTTRFAEEFKKRKGLRHRPGVARAVQGHRPAHAEGPARLQRRDGRARARRGSSSRSSTGTSSAA